MMTKQTTANHISGGDKFKVVGGKEKGQILYCMARRAYSLRMSNRTYYSYYDVEGNEVNFTAGKNRKVEILDTGYIPVKNLRQWKFVEIDGKLFQVTSVNAEIFKLRAVLGFKNGWKGWSDLDGRNDYTIPRSNENRPVKLIHKPEYNYYVHLIDDASVANLFDDLLNSQGGYDISRRVILNNLLDGYSWAKARGDETLAERKMRNISDFLKIIEWEDGNLNDANDLLSKHGIEI